MVTVIGFPRWVGLQAIVLAFALEMPNGYRVIEMQPMRGTSRNPSLHTLALDEAAFTQWGWGEGCRELREKKWFRGFVMSQLTYARMWHVWIRYAAS